MRELPRYVEGVRRRHRAVPADRIHGQRLSDQAERVPRRWACRSSRPISPEIRRFNAEHGDIVRGRRAMPMRSPPRCARRSTTGAAGDVERRIAVAHANSWQSRIDRDDASDRRGARAARGDGAAVGRDSCAACTAGRAARIAQVVARRWPRCTCWSSRRTCSGGRRRRCVRSAPPAAADAIVVFAGGVGESGKAGGGAQERVAAGRRSVSRPATRPYLILSSGYVYSFTEAEVDARARRRSGRAGVRDRARAARDEHLSERDVRRRRSCASTGGDASCSSARRTTCAARCWSGTSRRRRSTVLPTPVAQSQFYEHARGASLEQMRGILQEYVAILGYWRRGWI